MTWFMAWWQRRRERAQRRRVASLLAKAAAADAKVEALERMFQMPGRHPAFPGHWVELIAAQKWIAAESRSLAHHYAEEEP